MKNYSSIPSTLHIHLQDFLDYIASEKGLSQNTIEAYERDILAFMTFIAHQGLAEFFSVKESHLVEFLSHLKGREYASATICRALIALKVLFRFLKRENIVPINIAFYFDTPQLWQLIPEVLSCQEVEKLLLQPNVNTS